MPGKGEETKAVYRPGRVPLRLRSGTWRLAANSSNLSIQMNNRLFAFWAVLMSAFPLVSGAQITVTRNPKVEEASADYVKITRVEITEDHTAIYLRYVDGRNSEVQVPEGVPPEFRDYFRRRQQPGAPPEIWIDPKTRLYKPGDVNTKFRFLRAEGIPTNPERKQVGSGEVVECVAYFEKVTPGIEIIDFYEGKSTGNTTAWNFYGIHIKNPDPGKVRKPAPEKAAEAPEEKTAAAEPKAPAPAGFAGLSGVVLNAETGEPVAATIRYVENGDTISVSSGSGRYRVGLEAGKQYTFRASAKGFGEETWQLDTSADSATGGVFEHDFRLSPLKEGTTFTLENIYFETSSYTLLSESFEELDKFVQILNDNPNLYIRVEGHTDNVGDFDKNVELSRNRADAVKKYLAEKGISPERIETKGYGPTKPVAKGSSEEQRRKNRRVEIVILKS